MIFVILGLSFPSSLKILFCSMFFLTSPYTPLPRFFSKPLAPFLPQTQTHIQIKIHEKSRSISLSVCPKPTTTLTNFSSTSSHFSLNIEAEEPLDEDSSPWEGALIYKRDASGTHVEYATTLERLGLSRLSTEVSRRRAKDMGIRLPPNHRVGGDGTPVLVSVDVTRRKRRLKLDGIVRTVITLGCFRCAEPAAESVFSNFTLLLTEDPVEESDDEINMGVIYGEDKHRSTINNRTEEEADEKDIDPEDKFYFPSEEKEIDISKPIRDLIHLEITLNATCGPTCKGLCLKCGANLNKLKCRCKKEEIEDGDYGPLKNLRKQMQER